MAVQFNVKAIDAATGQLITTPLVVRVDAGLSGTVRNTNPANFYAGPPLFPTWIGDVEVTAAGYAPWTTGANPQIVFRNSSVEVIASLTPFRRPFKAAPRLWAANMCGIRLPYLPPIPGGAADASLFLTWLDHLYDPAVRTRARKDYLKRYKQYLLSWPDARSAGVTIQQFAASCQEIIDLGGFPAVMLSSKDHDPSDVPTILAGLVPVLARLVGLVPIFCIGWELSLWLTPTQVQELIDAISPICIRQVGTLVYVHFQQGYPSFQQPGGTVADFWKLQVGKLTGLLYQKIIEQNDAEFLDSIHDCLERFGGGFGMPLGFDFVGLELSALTQFAGTCSEAEGDRIGRVAINAPKVNGVGVSGSGNGF